MPEKSVAECGAVSGIVFRIYKSIPVKISLKKQIKELTKPNRCFILLTEQMFRFE